MKLRFEKMPEKTEKEPRPLATTNVPATAMMSSGGYVPATLDDLYSLAEKLSKSDMVPKDYQGKPGNIVVAMMKGRELGLPPISSLESIATINGRASLFGDAVPGICMATGELEEWDEADQAEIKTSGTARCMVKRRGRKPITRTFGEDDAKQANLLGKAGPWTQYPWRQKMMRARGFAFRDAFPDVFKGMHLREEMLDVDAIETTGRVVNESGTPTGGSMPPQPEPKSQASAGAATASSATTGAPPTSASTGASAPAGSNGSATGSDDPTLTKDQQTGLWAYCYDLYKNHAGGKKHAQDVMKAVITEFGVSSLTALHVSQMPQVRAKLDQQAAKDNAPPQDPDHPEQKYDADGNLEY
jgi:hypothetical protein